MALGQGINNWLKYGEIAKAGQPQSLASDALVELGALFTQMDFKTKKKEDDDPFAPVQATQDDVDEAVQNLDLSDPPLELETPEYIDEEEEIEHDFPKPISSSLPPKEAKVEDEPLVYGDSGLNIPFTFDSKKQGEPIMDVGVPGAVMHGVTLKGTNSTPENFVSQKDTFSNFTKKIKSAGSEFLDFLATPLFRQLDEGTAQSLKSLRYSREGDDDSPLFRVAHVDKSPFVRTDKMDYRQMRRATMPEYAKTLGGAAAAGYNLVIDKYNYDQKVKADYDEELEDQMGSLNVEAEFVGAESRAKYMEVAMQKKKELSGAFNDYANGRISKLDYENLKQKLYSDVNSIAQAGDNLSKLRADYLDKKGTFDVDASDSEMVDFYNTLEKDPDSLSISTIDGVDYITGKTRGGKDIKVPASKIANGTAGFRLVEKANISPIISSAVKDVNKFGQRETRTAFGFGVATATPEKAKEIGVASIRSTLANNENDLRSVMAQVYGIDHTAYQNFIGSDQKANTEQMLDDAAEHLYNTQVKPLIFEQEKTTRFVTPETQKKRGGGSSQTERLRAEFSKAWNKAPLPTEANIVNEYQNLIDTKRFRILKNKKGQVGIVDAKTGKGIPGSAVDFNQTPQQIKNQLLQYSKYQLYNTSGQTNLTEAQVQERAAQLLSNAGIN